MQWQTGTVETLLAQLPSRRRDADKSDFGHVLVVGGNTGMLGAVILAASAAARSGAGLVSVATHPHHAALVSVAQPTVMSYGISQAAALHALIAKATTVVVGPGLGQDDWAKTLLLTVLDSRQPLVVDADALNLVATESWRLPHAIITPHPGEAARLLAVSVAQIQAERLLAARTLHTRYESVVVLKGAGTLVVADKHVPMRCDLGNPGMASAGMGDVLSGIIAGLLAQGLTRYQAACLGVVLHAQAGDKVAKQRGQRSLLASDVIAVL